MPAELQAERREHTLVLTISDPGAHNALSEQVFTAGVEALGVAESDPDIRCIVLRGQGEHFSGDLNLPLWRETPQAAAQMRRHFHGFAEALRVHPKPVVAAVEGLASGDGFWLAMACDLVVAASDARFVPFPSHAGDVRGACHEGLLQSLAPRLSRNQLLEWMWLSEPVGVERLHGLGLVNRVADSGQALRDALEIARRLAQCAPQALAADKECVNALTTAPASETTR